MYAVDGKDEIVEIEDLPLPASGAPMPLILADDQHLMLGYEIAPGGEELAVLRFPHSLAHFFGPPNEESWRGHPLAQRGLTPGGVYEVRHSSWCRALERLNRVHPRHDPRRYDRYRHFVFAFHDETFECIAEEVVLAATLSNGEKARASLLAVMAEILR